MPNAYLATPLQTIPKLHELNAACPAVYIKSVQPDKLKIKLALIDAQDSDQPPAAPEYFITDGPLTYWRYSPEGCPRVIERHFERV